MSTAERLLDAHQELVEQRLERQFGQGRVGEAVGAPTLPGVCAGRLRRREHDLPRPQVWVFDCLRAGLGHADSVPH